MLSESETPRGVVRKLLKSRRPCSPQSHKLKKPVARQQDEDMETGPRDTGTPTVELDSKSRTSIGNISSATKLKLAAFSATDIGVSC